MSPDPFLAVKNAIEHYRIDEVLISTFAGESSRWLEEDLIGRVREITEKQVEHIEVGRPAAGRRRRRRRGGGVLMESATVALGHGHADEHHGPPEANQSSRIDHQTLGILLFIVSEVMLFGAFFASYFFLRVVVDPPAGRRSPTNSRSRSPASTRRSWSPRASRSTTRWSRSAAATGPGMKLGLLLTWMLGATFLFIQINEYVHIGFSARDLSFGSIFYSLTGLHGAHVFVGLMLLTLRHDPRLPRPLRPQGRGPPGRRGAGDLLALRRRHVDHRLRDRLHPVETGLASRFRN